MLVISDTGPLRYLVEIGEEEVLPLLFGRVIAPPGVIGELHHANTPGNVSEWAKHPPAWLEVLSPRSVDSTLRLDHGEAEAISLAAQLGADVLLIDERDGTRVARARGLFTTGTLGVLELAAERVGLSLPEALAKLDRTSFHGSRRIVQEMLRRDRVRRTGKQD